jgi:hypothetical protein
MKWVHAALDSLGSHEVIRGKGAADFPELSQSCDLLILGHKGLSGRWPNIRDAFPLRKACVVQWYFDLVSLHKGIPFDRQPYVSNVNHLEMMRACDLVCVKEKGLLDEYRRLGIDAEYLDQGCAVDVKPILRQPEPQWDVLLWGQGGPDYPERTRDARDLADAGFRVAWAIQGGSPPSGVDHLAWCHPDMLPDLAGRASLVLSVDRRHDIEGYWSDRFWMALGMGCCVLRRATPGLPDGPFITYSTRGELISKSREILSRPGDQANTPRWAPGAIRFGEEARTWCLNNHTLAHRCRELLALVAARTAAGLVR